ncbi:MAG TPA: hypothetical protein VHT02_03150, partial [Methylocella sp.]|nr:hypothetical protein [Methylocella sp.]
GLRRACDGFCSRGHRQEIRRRNFAEASRDPALSYGARSFASQPPGIGPALFLAYKVVLE